MAAVGIASAPIVAIALKDLGFKAAAIAIGTTLPIIAGTIGIVAAGTAAFELTAIFYTFY